LRCSCEAAAIMKDAAVKAGAPSDAICCFNTPSLAGTQELMKHRRTSVILATGGMGMVRAAYSSGKPAFGVGPGNVPAFIDTSADLSKGVADVVFGKTFDNGTICSSEQAIVIEESLREAVLRELAKNGAHLLGREEAEKLGKLMVNLEAHTINPKFVGKSAVKVAELAGIQVPPSTRVLVAVLEKVGREEPLSAEKLSPVLALYMEKDRASAMQRCVELLRFGGLGHTCAIHAKDDGVIREYGLKMPAYRVVVNSPSPLGSIGSSTNLFPAMTLGCGAAGGNITSDNISPLHLINIKRVAYEARPVTHVSAVQVPVTSSAAAPSTAASCAACAHPEPETSNQKPETPVNWSVSRAVDRFFASKQAPASAATVSTPSAPQPTPSQATRPALPLAAAAVPKPRPVEFVSEAEIRAAVKRKAKIHIGPKTIITPAARDLAAEYDVLVRVD
jgi:acetaldehyde dehydrogenase (acetylating)